MHTGSAAVVPYTNSTLLSSPFSASRETRDGKAKGQLRAAGTGRDGDQCSAPDLVGRFIILADRPILAELETAWGE